MPDDDSLIGYYLAGNSAKKSVFQTVAEQVWLLEYYHGKIGKWLYLDKGKGKSFGPWGMERAITEMNAWAHSMDKELGKSRNPEWVRDGVSWRIRNLQTNEVILQSIFGT